MKPVRLTFCGINSFSERTEIDFTKLLEFGIFGIFGDTGSGKSTVLDCIGFALYGDVARAKNSIADIIHYAADKAYVHFEFEIVYEGARRTFRVERDLKRKGPTQSLKVYERKGDSLLVLADGVRDGNALLERIIGLEQKDFEKCIALPQGEFAQFVKAARSERLKLISRLFNLEAYGEALLKRAGGKMTQAREDLRVAEGKLEQYADLTPESCAACRERVAALTREDASLRSELSALREQEKALAMRVQLRAEQLRLTSSMQALEAKKDEMRTLNEELERLGKASAVLRDNEEAVRTAARLTSCRENDARAQAEEERARKQLDKALLWDVAGAEAREQALTEAVAQANSNSFRRNELEKAQKKLAATEAKLATERAAFEGFSYEEERAAIEDVLVRLGSGNFLTYAEQNGKAALLHGEYAVFARELTQLTERHPTIDADSRPLIDKYTRLSEGGTTDLAALRSAYEQTESQRKELNDRLLMLEKRKGKFDRHLAELQALAAEYSETKERIAELTKEGIPAPTSGDPEGELLAFRREKKRRMQAREEAQKAFSEAQTAHVAAAEQLRAAQETDASARERLGRSLLAGAFSDAAQAQALVGRYGDPERARSRVEEYKNEYAAVRSRLRELASSDLSDATPESLNALKEQIAARDARASQCARELAVGQEELARSEEGLRRKEQLSRECDAFRTTYARFERLRKLIEGNKFMEFIAEEYLQTVAVKASGRLLSLTDGRYFLRYESGFFVGDNFNSGNLRSVGTLSGGETFLVSLSLALALSAEICARSLRPIEFFFLDEGFGTLDEHLVDVVMDSLERLKNEHFSIGIISHVEELKHRIERKLLVKKATEQHGSQIEME